MMFSIGELSKIVGLKVPTIRYYEQMGLIDPPERSRGNQRRYSKAEVQRLSFVRHSRELGFALGEIRDLLRLSVHPNQPCCDAHVIAQRHLEATVAKIKKLQRLKKELERISKCDSNALSSCSVIETLADHQLCISDH